MKIRPPSPAGRWSAASLALLLLATVFPSAGAAETRADAVADRLMAALGGEPAWQATRYLRFTFAGFRTHHWDKHQGRHRLEYTDRDGHAWIVLENLGSRQGRAWRDGEELAGEALAEALEGAYAAWINDTYWLVMPYKLRDPGVNLTYDGEEVIDGVAYDKLKLTFDGVGLTPGDTYWAYVNRDTGLMDRWAYVLQSFEEGQPPTQWLWRGWQRYGDILLAPERYNPATGRELPLDDIAVFDQLPDAVFDSPTPVAEGR